jgi:hypothetical protein
MEIKAANSVDLKEIKGPVMLLCYPGFEVILGPANERGVREITYRGLDGKCYEERFDCTLSVGDHFMLPNGVARVSLSIKSMYIPVLEEPLRHYVFRGRPRLRRKIPQ